MHHKFTHEEEEKGGKDSHMHAKKKSPKKSAHSMKTMKHMKAHKKSSPRGK